MTNYLDQNECIRRIEELRSFRTHLRNRERNIKNRFEMLNSVPELSNSDLKDFEKSLDSFLPDYLRPGNVGPLNAATWKFTFSVDFDFGVNPNISTNLRQTQSFQVTQESAFMITSVSRDSREVSLAGSLGPWQVTFKDAQSTRQFNSSPIPFQAIGTKGNDSVYTVPYFLFPNAKYEIEMSGFNTTPFLAVGEAVHQLSFSGYRMRVEDAQSILSAMYKNR